MFEELSSSSEAEVIQENIKFANNVVKLSFSLPWDIRRNIREWSIADQGKHHNKNVSSALSSPYCDRCYSCLSAHPNVNRLLPCHRSIRSVRQFSNKQRSVLLSLTNREKQALESNTRWCNTFLSKCAVCGCPSRKLCSLPSTKAVAPWLLNRDDEQLLQEGKEESEVIPLHPLVKKVRQRKKVANAGLDISDMLKKDIKDVMVCAENCSTLKKKKKRKNSDLSVGWPNCKNSVYKGSLIECPKKKKKCATESPPVAPVIERTLSHTSSTQSQTPSTATHTSSTSHTSNTPTHTPSTLSHAASTPTLNVFPKGLNTYKNMGSDRLASCKGRYSARGADPCGIEKKTTNLMSTPLHKPLIRVNEGSKGSVHKAMQKSHIIKSALKKSASLSRSGNSLQNFLQTLF